MKHVINRLKNPAQHLKNERGMATIETIPLVFVFLFLLCYELGMFGVIHTGIMNSISSRTYAFETFRNRTNLTFLRDSGPSMNTYREMGNRTHAVRSERTRSDESMGVATERPIRVGIPMEPNTATRNDVQTHNDKVHSQQLVGYQKRNTTVEVNPVWTQVQYGICLNATCGE